MHRPILLLLVFCSAHAIPKVEKQYFSVFFREEFSSKDQLLAEDRGNLTFQVNRTKIFLDDVGFKHAELANVTTDREMKKKLEHILGMVQKVAQIQETLKNRTANPPITEWNAFVKESLGDHIAAYVKLIRLRSGTISSQSCHHTISSLMTIILAFSVLS